MRLSTARPHRARAATIAVTAVLTGSLLGLTATGAAADDDTREPLVSVQAPSATPPAPGRVSAQAVLPIAALPGRITSSLTSTARASRYLGPHLSGTVVELDSDAAPARTVWRHNVGRTRIPASTQKLLTTLTVLRSMDASSRLTTTVSQDTVKRDRLYLRGAGDPSLTSARLAGLARAVATDLKRQRRTYAAVYVDTSALPTTGAAPGWKSSYLRSEVQRVQGLPLAGYRGPDAAASAGRLFAAHLAREGVTTRFRTAAITPQSTVLRAKTNSATIGALVATMLAVSNNDYAEFLLRHAAVAAGRPGTWSGAIANEVQVLREAGVPLGGLRIADGSGLSRSNRMPVTTLAAVVGALWKNPDDASIVFAWGAMPRAGQSGTLASRFTTSYQSCARGQVQAKTGTLADTVALAGIAHGVDGRDRVFVLLENGIVGRNTSVRRAVDTLGTIVVGCRLR